MKKLTLLFALALSFSLGACSKNKKEDAPVTAQASDPFAAFQGTLKANVALSGGEGLKLSGSPAGSPFAQCGLKNGDIVLEANGTKPTLDRSGANLLKQTCLDGGTFEVERNGVVTTTK